MDSWAAEHDGKAFEGVSWWSTKSLCNARGCPSFLGGGKQLYLRDGSGASAVTIWLNGVLLGGCKSWIECRLPIVLKVPTLAMGILGSQSSEDHAHVGTATSLVIAINTNATGQLRRVFTLD